MESETWTHRITTWRAAPGAVRARVCRQRIPAQVADSMAFEREAVPLRTLEHWHAAPDGPATAQTIVTPATPGAPP